MAIPENRKIPAEQLSIDTAVNTLIDTRVPPANPDQIINTGDGFATIASVYDETIGTVTFNTNKVQGSSASPQYNFLTVSNTNPRDLNNVVVKHSSLVVPAVLVDPLDETWGTKPAYLIVQGDAYLVGEDNVNTLSFVFYELIKISGVSYHDVVVCTVTAHTGMNRDADRIKVSLLIHHDYNENADPVQNDSIINRSIYGELFPCDIIGVNIVDNEPEYIFQSGINYSFKIGHGTNPTGNFNDRPYRVIDNNIVADLALANQELTYITRVSFPETGDSDVALIGNANTTSGFQFSRTVGGDIRSRVYYTTGNRAINSSFATKVDFNTGFWVIAIVVKKPTPDSDQIEYRMYLKSTTNSLAFTEILNTTNTNSLNIGATLVNNNNDPIRLDSLSLTATNGKIKEDDDTRLYARALTLEEISTIATELDG